VIALALATGQSIVELQALSDVELATVVAVLEERERA
jgi:hypothetical protein